MDIRLTDNDVQKLLVLCKEILTQYNIQLEEKCKGTINITATNSEKSFVLSYFVRPGKVSLNFRETEFNICLIRINLNNGFHKNSNNEIIRGNRINIFSEEEYLRKNDSSTYMRAYALPYKIFEDNSDFVNQLFALLEYTKKRHNDNINVETNLFF